jgi:HSP90 family molecular chaperone
LEGLRAGAAAESKLADGAELLLGQAQLAEGTLPKDPVRFAKLVSGLMA